MAFFLDDVLMSYAVHHRSKSGGEYLHSDRYEYYGDVREGLPEGHGLMLTGDGDLWSGGFSRGMPHGLCLYRHHKGFSIVAQFVNGEFCSDQSFSVYNRKGGKTLSATGSAKKSNTTSRKRRTRGAAKMACKH